MGTHVLNTLRFENLKVGLAQTAASIPWITGKVVGAPYAELCVFRHDH